MEKEPGKVIKIRKYLLHEGYFDQTNYSSLSERNSYILIGHDAIIATVAWSGHVEFVVTTTQVFKITYYVLSVLSSKVRPGSNLFQHSTKTKVHVDAK